MATNIQITTGEDCAVLYFQDGQQMVVDPNVTQGVQLVDGGFCTISEAADPDASEHPPSPNEKIEAFIERMIEFWTTLLNQIKGTEVNPL